MSRLLHGLINYLSVTPGCSCPSNPVLTVLERHAPAHAGGCFEAAIDRFTPDPSIYDPLTFAQMPGGRWTAQMFPGNIIPVSRFSAVSQRLNAIAVKDY